MTTPDEPNDPGTGSADGPPGGTSRRSYSWVIGLVAVLAVLGVISLIFGGFGGDANVPSR